MIFTVGELAEALSRYHDDLPVRVSHDPQGGPGAACLIEVEIEDFDDEQTVVIYPA
jgi:hypothetical protein